VVDPRQDQWLQALDWTGKFVGTIKLPYPLLLAGFGYEVGVTSSPDGSRIFVGKQMLDSDGRVLMDGLQPPGPKSTFVADDNRHLCGMRGYDTNATPAGPFGDILFSLLPGSTAQDVARFPLESLGQVGHSAAGCSFASNRALVVRTAVAWTTDWWLVRLTDGTIVRHQTFPAEYLSGVVGSEDLSYLAENPGLVKPDPGLVAAPYAVIRATADGTEAGRLTGYVVRWFSGDGSLVLAMRREDPESGSARVIEWRSGKVIWTSPDGLQLNEIRALPGGRDVALAFSAPTRTVPPGCGQPSAPPCKQEVDLLRDIVIVHGDGSATAVPGRYRSVW